MWTFPSFESVRQDIRYALRTLWRSPGSPSWRCSRSTLGIAGNTAIFSLVDAVRLRALPYAEPERLVVLWGNVLRDDARASWCVVSGLSRLAGADPERRGDGGRRRHDDDAVGRGRGRAHPRRDRLGGVLLRCCGVQAATGRTFTARRRRRVPQKVAVAVISDGFWRRRFGGDPMIVGHADVARTAAPFTVIGVMPPGFAGSTDRADVWIPFVMSDSAEALAERGNRGFQVLARLKPGTSHGRRAAGARRDLAASRGRVSGNQRETRRRGQPARRRAVGRTSGRRCAC